MYYGDNNLKKRDVGPRKLVDFEGISRHCNVNIMLYEPKNDRGKDAGSIWWWFYGKTQHKNGLPTITMELLGGHCFYIKKMDVLRKQWQCKGCSQIFTRNICSGGKFKHILNSSEKVLCGGETKFSYTACWWIEAQAIEAGKHIHHKMCGNGGERMVIVWVLNDESEKEPASFCLMDMNLKPTQYISFMNVIGMGIDA